MLTRYGRYKLWMLMAASALESGRYTTAEAAIAADEMVIETERRFLDDDARPTHERTPHTPTRKG